MTVKCKAPKVGRKVKNVESKSEKVGRKFDERQTKVERKFAKAEQQVGRESNESRQKSDESRQKSDESETKVKKQKIERRRMWKYEGNGREEVPPGGRERPEGSEFLSCIRCCLRTQTHAGRLEEEEGEIPIQ